MYRKEKSSSKWPPDLSFCPLKLRLQIWAFQRNGILTKFSFVPKLWRFDFLCVWIEMRRIFFFENLKSQNWVLINQSCKQLSPRQEQHAHGCYRSCSSQTHWEAFLRMPMAKQHYDTFSRPTILGNTKLMDNILFNLPENLVPCSGHGLLTNSCSVESSHSTIVITCYTDARERQGAWESYSPPQPPWTSPIMVNNFRFHWKWVLLTL